MAQLPQEFITFQTEANARIAALEEQIRLMQQGDLVNLTQIWYFLLRHCADLPRTTVLTWEDCPRNNAQLALEYAMARTQRAGQRVRKRQAMPEPPRAFHQCQLPLCICHQMGLPAFPTS